MSDVTITGIDTHVYLVKDVPRALSFWRDAMGLRATWENEQGAEFELPDGSTFGIWRMDDDSWTAGSGIMFAVPDVASAVKSLRAKGVSVREDVADMPSCTMAFATDTEGNAFILHKRKGDEHLFSERVEAVG